MQLSTNIRRLPTSHLTPVQSQEGGLSLAYQKALPASLTSRSIFGISASTTLLLLLPALNHTRYWFGLPLLTFRPKFAALVI